MTKSDPGPDPSAGRGRGPGPGLAMNLTPFLLFDGRCAEAMTFYQSCLGGELAVVRVADTPMAAQAPPGQQQKVAFAHLRSGAVELSATDWQHPTRTFHPGNTVGVYLTSDDAMDLSTAFDKLSVGAEPGLLDPLTDMPFGLYGHLRDAFGVHWFFRGGRRPSGSTVAGTRGLAGGEAGEHA